VPESVLAIDSFLSHAGASMSFMPLDNSVPWGSPVTAGRERHDLRELSIGYGLIVLAVWTPRPWQWPVNLAALAWVFFATVVSFDGWSALGLRLSGTLRSLWVVGLALLLAAAAISVAARLHTLHLPGTPLLLVQRYWGYALWAFLQEFLLLGFILPRLLRLLPGKNAAVLAAAGLFALAHLPNPILTPATLIWGVAAGSLFLRYRNLYTLALAHAIFGIAIATTIPGPVTHHMKVGLGYLMYRPSEHHHRGQKSWTSGLEPSPGPGCSKPSGVYPAT
jgi:membrane protease YdiL (CAAX protease family)